MQNLFVWLLLEVRKEKYEEKIAKGFVFCFCFFVISFPHFWMTEIKVGKGLKKKKDWKKKIEKKKVKKKVKKR